MCTFVGSEKPADLSIPGQNSVWKYVMSFPIKWWISILLIAPPGVKRLPLLLAPSECRRHVADRRVEPDVPVITRAVGDLEAEIRGRPGDVPISQRFVEEVSLEVIGDLPLEVAARLSPLVEKVVQLFQPDEQVPLRAQFRRGARQGADRVDQVRGSIRGPALVAVIAILVSSFAFGTSSFHEPIGQECPRLGVVQLRDIVFDNQVISAQRLPDLAT
jgi:hypothetical protein